MIGTSPAMLRVRDLIARYAKTETPVVIVGESGTGKELTAKQLHEQSPRATGPFVPVNCAAIPEGLMESELFGHAKGSFTDAVRTRKGRFAMARGGTLFLDEIGDMSPLLQAKLLRVLQEKEMEPVGADMPVPVDVRVIAATHQNLKKSLRADLYYRPLPGHGVAAMPA